MLFTEPLFLFIFLPALLGLYFCAPRRARNFLLLVASLLFYAWGERTYVAILLFSIVLNYVGGLLISQATAGGRRRRLLLVASLAGNLLLLTTFKYAGFLTV